MIKLIVDGACKECPWQDIRLMGETARCIHDYLCKYVESNGNLCKYVESNGIDWEAMQQSNAENKEE